LQVRTGPMQGDQHTVRQFSNSTTKLKNLPDKRSNFFCLITSDDEKKVL